LKIPSKAKTGNEVPVKVTVSNTGKMAGDEVVQLYLKDEEASTQRPIVQLEGFERIHLQPGESKVVEFILSPRQFSMIGKDEKRVIEPGTFVVSVGGGQPGKKVSNSVSKEIKLTGKNLFVE
jgi:beta-glucosidase